MTEKQRAAYEWAKNQQFHSVAADYARELAGLVDELEAAKAKETVEARAVKIAAKVMQAAGLCRYESAMKCRRLYVDETTCDKCIRAWLISKARNELKKGGQNGVLHL